MDVEVRAVRDFLDAHEPFNQLPDRSLDAAVASLQLRYFRRGTRVLTAGMPNNSLYVVRSGAADILDETGTLVERVSTGDSFGAISLLERGPSHHTITTIEDSLLLVMPGEVFLQLHHDHAAVRDFHDAVRARRVRHAVEAVQAAVEGAPAWLRLTLGEVASGREPITIVPDASIREAAQVMARHRVSALLVADPGLTGIVTDRDLRTKVVAAGLDTGRPVSQVMTREPFSLPTTASAFEALLEMTTRTFHHLPLVDDGRLVGLVSQGDLLRLEQANPVFIVRDIGRQTTRSGIAEVVRTVPRLVAQFVAQDASADDITALLTAVADATHRRLIALAEAELGPAPAPWCWLVLGSQARRELGLASDQDHALVFADEVTDDAWYAALAERVSAGLAECGYPLCDGDVMATNPRWRASQSQWRQHFAQWVRAPEPQALLEAQIFFDARVVHGQASLFEEVRSQVLAATPQSNRFLAHLAAQAVRREPPLGFFRGFVLEKEGEHRDQLDLKSGGVHAVIELVRVHALAHGIAEVQTTGRLRALGARGHLASETVDDLVDAFLFCSHVRLRHQSQQHARGDRPDNFISPDELSTFDKRHLRDAFGIIRKAQEALAVVHNTHVLT